MKLGLFLWETGFLKWQKLHLLFQYITTLTKSRIIPIMQNRFFPSFAQLIAYKIGRGQVTSPLQLS
jgi:hypothetical protein